LWFETSWVRKYSQDLISKDRLGMVYGVCVPPPVKVKIGGLWYKSGLGKKRETPSEK
jgi:hypothetical protein